MAGSFWHSCAFWERQVELPDRLWIGPTTHTCPTEWPSSSVTLVNFQVVWLTLKRNVKFLNMSHLELWILSPSLQLQDSVPGDITFSFCPSFSSDLIQSHGLWFHLQFNDSRFLLRTQTQILTLWLTKLTSQYFTWIIINKYPMLWMTVHFIPVNSFW